MSLGTEATADSLSPWGRLAGPFLCPEPQWYEQITFKAVFGLDLQTNPLR